MRASSSHRVVALAYDGLCTFEFGCTVEIFALPRPELGVAWYRFDVCSAERKPLRAAGGVEIKVRRGPGLLALADTIVIPGWRDPEEAPPRSVLEAIRAAHARGARLCSICSGVFVLAAAGVLTGKRVTTHWRYAEKLSAAYPELTVNAQALYVDEGQILTSAGSAAGLDMLIHLVRLDYGAKVANIVARRLVIPAHREGGQAQYLPRPVPSDERGRLTRLMDWIRSRLGARHTVASLARRASMSSRTLQRQFRETVGLTPGEWLVRERVGFAKELLEQTGVSLEQVAARCGFGSQESFRRHFRRVAGTSPSAYRKRFAAAADEHRKDAHRAGVAQRREMRDRRAGPAVLRSRCVEPPMR
jgi:AraC family transcriptional regulator, transcriptional activator FtrA